MSHFINFRCNPFFLRLNAKAFTNYYKVVHSSFDMYGDRTASLTAPKLKCKMKTIFGNRYTLSISYIFNNHDVKDTLGQVDIKWMNEEKKTTQTHKSKKTTVERVNFLWANYNGWIWYFVARWHSLCATSNRQPSNKRRENKIMINAPCNVHGARRFDINHLMNEPSHTNFYK